MVGLGREAAVLDRHLSNSGRHIMALFRITPTTSVFKDVLDFQHPDAFNRDTAGADTLIVEQGAYLISVPGVGAVLANTGAWTVTVNGSIVSQNNVGIFLEADNAAVSTIKIGVNGEVQGAGGGILPAGIVAESSANINNSGLIDGAIVLSGGNDTVTNSGVINGDVALEDGTNHLANSGTINGSVLGGLDTDTVTDFVIVGDVVRSGTINGTILLGDGNDTFNGGANPETFQDGNGADVVTLGGGNDTYIATGNLGLDGIDIVRGGAGIDTYDAGDATGDVRIYLDSVNHAGPEVVATSTATGTDISAANKDRIFGFENAIAGAGNDFIYGTGGANVLDGGDGGDVLVGFEGKDTLNGGSGNDSLSGGRGKDQLTGGLGGDNFGYTALSDSGITAATRDLIADFEPGIDHIHLSSIDANTTNGVATNDAFTFIGTNTPFTGSAGQLHAFWSAIGQIIEGDVNGDAKADFSIEIADPTHAITLASTDFIL
jgi:Ca2+-binding RTX toxin-like protein